MSRRRNFARTLAAAFLLAVATALLLLPSAPGHAQTTTNTYVSNISQGQDEDWNTTLKRAQSFITGSQSGGYALTSVDIVYEDQHSDAFSAAIWTVDSDNEPDDGDNNNKIADLTAPGSFDAGTLTFTAPAGTTLDASTTYVVLITPTVGSASLKFDTTDSNNEDANGAAGWSIGDAAHGWSPGNQWYTLSSGEAIRIAIKGTTAAANNPATGAPTISGTAVVGEPMRAVTSGIMDSDGLTSPGYTYQWIRVDGATESDISGATSSVYTPVAADLGKTIKVKVSFTDDGNNDETLTSAATAAVANAQTTTNTYVSNINQGNDNQTSGTEKTAQRFTTGSQSGGYTVTSVDIGYDDSNDYKFSAAIYTVDSNGYPDSQVFALTPPTGTWAAGALTFTAPANSTLSASTTYTVRMVPTANGVILDTTTSGDEDSGAFAGWSIRDSFEFQGSTGWTQVNAEAIRIAIKGTTAAPQTVAWNATLTSADSWAFGSTYTYDGYASSAISAITTTQGSLSPDSFTVGTTTHTVELLGVREGTDNRLYLFTDTAASTSDLAGYAMEFTVDGSTTTLNVKDATNESSLGFYWADSLHSFDEDDWQAKTITVKLRTPNNAATGAPAITGTAQVGQTLTAGTSGIMDADGLTTPGYTYQWVRVDGSTESDISGATSSTYTLVAADLGKTIKVKVSFTDDASTDETLTSAATAAVTAADDCAGDTTTTCSVSLGGSVTGDIELLADTDYFSLSVTSGAHYWIDAEGSDTRLIPS